MIHRVIYGALERFFAILTEHFAGKFPLWLAPVQAIVLSVSDNFNPYAEKVKKELDKVGIRAELDIRDETVGKKIREAQLQRIKYVFVVGGNEQEKQTVNVRDSYQNKVLGEKKLKPFIKEMQKEIEEKRI
jgi:threonyl-tRNA synthetase